MINEIYTKLNEGWKGGPHEFTEGHTPDDFDKGDAVVFVGDPNEEMENAEANTGEDLKSAEYSYGDKKYKVPLGTKGVVEFNVFWPPELNVRFEGIDDLVVVGMEDVDKVTS